MESSGPWSMQDQGTLGCEMRSYRHLWARMRGGDVEGVACPGWIDRFDGVRVGGQWRGVRS